MNFGSTMTSWCMIVFQESADHLSFLSFSVCPSSPSSQLGNWLNVRGEEGGGGSGGARGEGRGGPRWASWSLRRSWSHKKRRGFAAAPDRPRSGADRDARHGAHLPGAALRPAAEPVCPQGRLQVYWGELHSFIFFSSLRENVHWF